MNNRILVISDLHAPFCHPDSIAFLTKLKKYYKPDTVVNIGDEMDYHAINVSHNIDPDLPSPNDELEIGKNWLHRLHKLFPRMVLLESNHGSMVLRRAMANKMSRKFLKTYNEILEVGNGWCWKDKHTIDYKGRRIIFAHQFCKDISKAVREFSMCAVQGHFHTVSEVKYVGNDFHLNWGMSVGCLVNKESLSMAYMKINVTKPILSVGVISDGIPYISPMVLKNNGSWDGNIYL